MEPSGILLDYVAPLAAACVAGGLIGLEREYRGQSAGLRTHTLVCLASAMLMVAAVHQVSWMRGAPAEVIRIDPVRMAHGILTGIGFLCGGVIFRQGLSVHGLTTAAALWTTSALGTLFGVGAYGLATGGAMVTLIVLVGFRWIDQMMPQGNLIDVAVAYRREGDWPADAFRQLMAEFGLEVRGGLRQTLTPSGAEIEIGATIKGPTDAQTNRLAQRLGDDARVTSFEIAPRND